jgi:hypothetical protein
MCRNEPEGNRLQVIDNVLEYCVELAKFFDLLISIEVKRKNEIEFWFTEIEDSKFPVTLSISLTCTEQTEQTLSLASPLLTVSKWLMKFKNKL